MKQNRMERAARAIGALLRAVDWDEADIKAVRDQVRTGGIRHVDVTIALGPRRASVERSFAPRERAR